MQQQSLVIKTKGRGFYKLDELIHNELVDCELTQGLCHLFVRHTSASLIVCENADPSVRYDLEGFMSKLVVDGDPAFRHRAEGDDDMAAHIRSVLTATSLTLPILERTLALGTWQSVYLWEHRTHSHTRSILMTTWGVES